MYGLKQAGFSLRQIALRLGRNAGTLSRELARHSRHQKPYLPCLAHRRALRWAARQRYQAPLKCPTIYLYVREHLREPFRWSPETIAGRLPLDHPGCSIDDDTIYRYVYGERQRRERLWKYLSLHRRRRLKKDGRKVRGQGRIKGIQPLELRPEEANRRLAPGHWESDNMEGVRSDRTAVSVTVDRLTRVTRLAKLKDHTSRSKTLALRVQFENEFPFFKRTLTLDRGAENKRHQDITRRTGIPVYFCYPYHSWEKGTVENTIGRLRRFIPKGESVDHITGDQLIPIQEHLNNTPRKVLGFLTPNEMLERMRPGS